MQPGNGYNLGFDDVKRFGALSSQRSSNASQPETSALMESIFSGDGEIDFKKMMMLQMASSNPMMAAMLMKNGGEMDFREMMMMSMAGNNPMMAAILLKKLGKSEGSSAQGQDSQQIGFRGLEKTETNYLNDKAEVSDVTPAKTTKLTEEQQEIAQKNGLFRTEKESIIIQTKQGDQTELLDQDGIIKDGGIDLKKAKAEHKKLEEQTQNNLQSDGINMLIDADRKDDFVLDSPGAYKLMGMDTKSVLGKEGKRTDILSSKGASQLDELERMSIAKKNDKGQYTIIAPDKFTTEQKEYLERQKKENSHKEALGSVVDGTAEIAVKTGESTSTDGKITDQYQKVTTDKKGTITGIDDKKPATVEKEHNGDITAAKPQLEISGLKGERLSEVAKVGKDGSVEIDADKLSADEYSALAKSGKISYGGSSALTLKSSKEGKAIQIELTGGANTVNLRGKAAAAISTKGEELQVNGESGTRISQIDATNAKHLVVKGGTLEDNLGKNNNLEAVKIENATLTKGLYVDNSEYADKNVALNLSGVQVKKGGVHVSTKGDADIKTQSSTTGDIEAKANNISATLSKTQAEDIKLKGEEVSFKGYKGSKADKLVVQADDLKATYNGMTVDKSDFSQVSDQTKMFVSKDSKPGDIKLKEKASATDTELVGEDDKTAESLKKETEIEAKKLGNGKDEVSQERLFKDFFDFNNEDYGKYRQQLNQGTPNYQSYGHGSTPGGEKSTPWWANALAGWNLGGQVVNSVYGNPYGIQQQPYQQTPWGYPGGYRM